MSSTTRTPLTPPLVQPSTATTHHRLPHASNQDQVDSDPLQPVPRAQPLTQIAPSSIPQLDPAALRNAKVLGIEPIPLPPPSQLFHDRPNSPVDRSSPPWQTGASSLALPSSTRIMNDGSARMTSTSPAGRCPNVESTDVCPTGTQSPAESGIRTSLSAGLTPSPLTPVLPQRNCAPTETPSHRAKRSHSLLSTGHGEKPQLMDAGRSQAWSRGFGSDRVFHSAQAFPDSPHLDHGNIMEALRTQEEVAKVPSKVKRAERKLAISKWSASVAEAQEQAQMDQGSCSDSPSRGDSRTEGEPASAPGEPLPHEKRTPSLSSGSSAAESSLAVTTQDAKMAAVKYPSIEAPAIVEGVEDDPPFRAKRRLSNDTGPTGCVSPGLAGMEVDMGSLDHHTASPGAPRSELNRRGLTRSKSSVSSSSSRGRRSSLTPSSSGSSRYLRQERMRSGRMNINLASNEPYTHVEYSPRSHVRAALNLGLEPEPLPLPPLSYYAELNMSPPLSATMGRSPSGLSSSKSQVHLDPISSSVAGLMIKGIQNLTPRTTWSMLQESTSLSDEEPCSSSPRSSFQASPLPAVMEEEPATSERERERHGVEGSQKMVNGSSQHNLVDPGSGCASHPDLSGRRTTLASSRGEEPMGGEAMDDSGLAEAPQSSHDEPAASRSAEEGGIERRQRQQQRCSTLSSPNEIARRRGWATMEGGAAGMYDGDDRGDVDDGVRHRPWSGTSGSTDRGNHQSGKGGNHRGPSFKPPVSSRRDYFGDWERIRGLRL
ncbi:hypothetical protein IE53DRAFT_370928 [Violaceomyces palustris]|uniref:Uncharacterized protein n=1 Tax=Violaceomyces palustris TaxID=1673888 RepID=A0ACD0NQK6_9BASI|nr:hypothetical protein IE53DRAFT_370928 [Violaceomyces palustris]